MTFDPQREVRGLKRMMDDTVGPPEPVDRSPIRTDDLADEFVDFTNRQTIHPPQAWKTRWQRIRFYLDRLTEQALRGIKEADPTLSQSTLLLVADRIRKFDTMIFRECRRILGSGFDADFAFEDVVFALAYVDRPFADDDDLKEWLMATANHVTSSYEAALKAGQKWPVVIPEGLMARR